MKSLQTVNHAHYNKRGIFGEKITGFFYFVSGAFTKLATTIVGGHFLEKVKRQKQNQYWVEADYNALKYNTATICTLANKVILKMTCSFFYIWQMFRNQLLAYFNSLKEYII